MRFQYANFFAVVSFAMVSFTANPGFGQTRLGLHVTQEELNIWKQRAASGPYKTTGDVRPNSPGDWARILANASQNLGNQRWAGYTGTGCVPAGSTLGAILPLGDHIRDAAFAYLVTGTVSYRTAVVNELLAQVAEPGVNFSNSSKWCAQPQYSDNDNMFRSAMWVSKYIYAYDYLLAGDQVYGLTLSSANRSTIETWLLNAATFYEALYNVGLSQIFLNRKADNYSFTSQGNTDCATDYSVPYYGGPTIKRLVAWINNRRATFPLVYGLVGIQQNNAILKAEAARAFREFFRFAVFPDGTPGELYRWSNNPAAALSYVLTKYGLLIQIADAFARKGDMSLYDYTTSLGACGTAGGTKGLQAVINEIAKYADHTYLRYGTNEVVNNGNANYLIDTYNDLTGDAYVLDHILAQSNLYYRSNYVRTIYMRTASGRNGYTLPGYPPNPSTGGYNAWGGPWGNQSGILFMFGQLESIVNPYPSLNSALAPPH